MNIGLLLFLITGQGAKKQKDTFKIEIPAFLDTKYIPSKYTCDGKDVSPEIVFKNIPEKAKSIAIIADDPDAPMGTWVHWVIYNIPKDTTHLKEGFPEGMKVGNICQGVNDFGKYAYGGPCPPSGAHRYFFKAYALDTVFECQKHMTKKELLKLMKGHIIAQDTVMKRYRRIKR